MGGTFRRIAVLTIATCAVAGCDRNLEPFDPGEVPEQPDLSRIFPPGAEQSAEDRPMFSGAMPAAPRGRGAPPVAASERKPIRGTVTLAADLADRVPDGAVLFLVARPGRSGPPVAVQRIASPRFPLDFTIGLGDHMVEPEALAGPLRVSARLDGDGDAGTRSSGDLQGVSERPVRPGDDGVSVVIDEVL